MSSEQVIILDSEVFVFNNWDESRFYDPISKKPRSLYWIPKFRKPDWDYKMYRGAAYLLKDLPECAANIMDYANSDYYRRHISGVVIFSTRNIKHLWQLLEKQTDLEKNMFELFNKEEELAFSDHDFYGLAAEYNLFENTVPTVMHNDLLGWYDNHDDPVFHEFKKDAMWSMCQNYKGYNTPQKYRTYMLNTVKHLNKDLPHFSYWNDNDNHLVLKKYIENGNIEFHSYKRQLNYTKQMRFLSMKLALDLLKSTNELCPTLVEVGTLRDKNVGGGHSTIKFAEYCSMYGGHLYSIDVDSQAIKHAIENTKNYHSWISFHEMDSVEFLQQFENPINFLYLDGLDSLPGDEEKASLKQLEEIKTALPKLTERAIVLLDDADLFNQGKTKYSSQYLEDNGFSLYVNNYQKLYARGFEKSSAVKLMLNRYAYKIQSVWKKY